MMGLASPIGQQVHIYLLWSNDKDNLTSQLNISTNIYEVWRSAELRQNFSIISALEGALKI